MKLSFFLLFTFPIYLFSQTPSITVDTIGHATRINFNSSYNNLIIGQGAGSIFSTGTFNTWIGQGNGSNNTTGEWNLSIGGNAGFWNTSGNYNVNVGTFAGNFNADGSGNVNIGDGAGYQEASSNESVKIGYLSGALSTGSRNVFIGSFAGYQTNGDDKLIIESNFNALPLITGTFANDSVIINGDLNITGKIEIGSVPLSAFTGILGSDNESIPPVIADNTVEIEITNVLSTTSVLITESIGFQLDTFTIASQSNIFIPHTGLTAEFPITFETDNASDINALQAWFANPSPQVVDIIIKDMSGNETSRINAFDFIPVRSGPGSGSRTSFTLKHIGFPNNQVAVEWQDVFGNTTSYNQATDKVVEITDVTNYQFTPAVQIDYNNKVVTLEMTYDEGQGIFPWVNGFANGSINQRSSMSIIETDSNLIEISRENFYEVVPFKYEVIYGFRQDTKIKAKVQLLYGFVEPG